MSEIILFNKPYGVLSQFTDSEERPTLAQFIQAPGFRAAGRLDMDSEGLLLLTQDGSIQSKITHPKNKWPKTYLVQLEGVPSMAQLQKLEKGLKLKDGPTLPAQTQLIAKKPNWLWQRTPPIRQRKKIPTSWLNITIREGRNRQVRRMMAAVGLPCLRLVRTHIGDFELGKLKPGETITQSITLP